MRSTVCVVVPATIPAPSACAATREYPQPQLGFILEFSADPAGSMGTYKTALVQNATAQTFSVKGNPVLLSSAAKRSQGRT